MILYLLPICILGNLDCPSLIKAFEADRVVKEAERNKKRKNTGTPTPDSKPSKKSKLEDKKSHGFDRGLEPEKIIGATDTSGIFSVMKKNYITNTTNFRSSYVFNEMGWN